MNIEHDIREKRFSTEIEGITAYATYRQTPSTFEILHTTVPPELSGRGIGSELMFHTYLYAVEQGLTFAPSCPYAVKWLQRHQFNGSSNG